MSIWLDLTGSAGSSITISNDTYYGYTLKLTNQGCLLFITQINNVFVESKVIGPGDSALIPQLFHCYSIFY